VEIESKQAGIAILILEQESLSKNHSEELKKFPTYK
jgi:hypothetical protein